MNLPLKKPLLNLQPRQDTPLWEEFGLIQEDKEHVWALCSCNKSLTCPEREFQDWILMDTCGQGLFSGKEQFWNRGHKAIQNFHKWVNKT